MDATVLKFPTARKRAYPNPILRRADLPEGVTPLVQPKRTPYANLSKTPELALLMAILSSMEGPIRWRIHKELARFEEHQGPGGYAEDLARLVRALPWHVDGKS